MVAEHAHQRGIGVQNPAVGRGDVDAFLERFEKLGEARFVAAQRGNVAREHGDAVNRFTAHHGMHDAVEVERRFLIFQADLEHAGPVTALEEPRHRTLEKLFLLPVAFLNEFADRLADDFGKRSFDQVGKAAIHGANPAVQGHGEEQVIEGVD